MILAASAICAGATAMFLAKAPGLALARAPANAVEALERDGHPLNIMESIARDMTDDQRAVSPYLASSAPQEVTREDDLFLGLGTRPKARGSTQLRAPEIEFAPARRVEGGKPE